MAGGDRWDTRGIQGDTQRERRTRIHEGYRRIQRLQGSQQVPGCNLEVSGSREVPIERASASSSAMGYRRIQRFQATAGVTGGYNAVFVGDKRLQWDTEVTAARPLSPTGYKAGTSCSGRLY